MVLSYSAIAKPTADTPDVISIRSPAPASTSNPSDAPATPASEEPAAAPAAAPAPVEAAPEASSSTAAAESSQEASSSSTIQHLILDAGPLLSLAPLRHLAARFYTTPAVLAELRDPKAREHWDRLGLAGVDVKVEQPSAEAMAKVSAFARKTGDYAVLSQTDLGVAALTYQYEVKVNGEENIRTEPGQKKKVDGKGKEKEVVKDEAGEKQEAGEQEEVQEEEEQEPEVVVEEITRSIDEVLLDPPASSEPTDTAAPADEPLPTPPTTSTPAAAPAAPQNQDEEDEDDGGEWITPSNLAAHRSRDLGLVTPSGSSAKPPAVACMTGDFAVQNILLGMGLGLVGEGGKKISKVKSWVLRCHACFKLCKDSSKRFCPSCGNASLIRTTVTTSAATGKLTVHLKQNFQYRTRGTIYSIPDPKMGRAKGQQKGGSGLILREDQREWQDAVRSEDIRRQKEDRRAAKGALQGWNDPDWLPEIITVGMSGKGRSGGHGLPSIGHGRKNPNQSRKTRK
ncbi:hypothetical protein IAT38_004692 [Cryptococcus sp. DSM 104549]